jgi:hypothetical protein
LENLTRPTAEEVLSDYDRSITKSHEEHVQRPRKRGKKVPQLGEQENQSCPPLNVFSTEVDLQPEVAREVQDAAANVGVSIAEYLGSLVEYPMADLAYQYKYGEPLVKPELIKTLPTKMRRLHDWYMKVSKEGLTWIVLEIEDEHFFRGNQEIHIEVCELFQLFNQDALDKSIVSCYYL